MTYPTTTSSRRTWLTTSVTLLAASALPFAATAAAPTPLEVWKDPNCGCCQDWVDHMQANGFAVKAHAIGNNAVRARLGLPQELGSCHTALVGGYVVEGHVPASDVRALLQQKPKALGLAVPGMPVGSPGMDGAVYGDRRDPYDVLLVARDGSTRIFKSYNTSSKPKATS
ncbi:DUF411 domain-containing protein [Acidovorax sp. ACV01]|uniref:DUF411 domain-containing protein n=1 Tax=Acidovorax sp. ACV01 TaxID=2769311 RepID=UPI0017814E9B|nr:DUF411 domain-containing protein [Acidovorax sp. ACV01]MBD9390746.1 DUF411 domain-containing protein [Acidovorax sp. ACV01]